MFFKKKKEVWEEVTIGQVKGWQCTPFNEFSNLKHLFTSNINDFNLGRHAPTIFPEKSVFKNREILCKGLEAPYENLLVLPLGHTDNILIIDEHTKEVPESDAVITQMINLPILITAADCVPILLYAHEKKLLCLVHAGWKGTAKNIVEKAVITMIEKYLIRPSQIIAAIGPAIEQKNYEVDKDVADQVVEATGTDEILDKKWRKPKLDLKKANQIQLDRIGVKDIYISNLDTAAHSSPLYSYRMQGKRSGRQGLIACFVN